MQSTQPNHCPVSALTASLSSKPAPFQPPSAGDPRPPPPPPALPAHRRSFRALISPRTSPHRPHCRHLSPPPPLPALSRTPHRALLSEPRLASPRPPALPAPHVRSGCGAAVAMSLGPLSGRGRGAAGPGSRGAPGVTPPPTPPFPPLPRPFATCRRCPRRCGSA